MSFTFKGQDADAPLPDDVEQIPAPAEINGLTAGVDSTRVGEGTQPSGLSAANGQVATGVRGEPRFWLAPHTLVYAEIAA